MENIDQFEGNLEYAAIQKLFNYELHKDFEAEVKFQELLDCEDSDCEDCEEPEHITVPEYYFYAYM